MGAALCAVVTVGLPGLTTIVAGLGPAEAAEYYTRKRLPGGSTVCQGAHQSLLGFVSVSLVSGSAKGQSVYEALFGTSAPVAPAPSYLPAPLQDFWAPSPRRRLRSKPTRPKVKEAEKPERAEPPTMRKKRSRPERWRTRKSSQASCGIRHCGRATSLFSQTERACTAETVDNAIRPGILRTNAPLA